LRPITCGRNVPTIPCSRRRWCTKRISGWSHKLLAGKRGGGQVRIELDHALNTAAPEPQAVLALDGALRRLEEIDQRASRVVELRWFVGLSVEEAADVMGISEKTVRREWNFAKAWLQAELEGEG
jgi:RNA polymerase sigma factor (TIGR02999 family)